MLAIAADGLAVNNAAHAIGLTICPSAKHTLDIPVICPICAGDSESDIVFIRI